MQSVIVVYRKVRLALNVNDIFQQDMLLARPCWLSILGHARKQPHASSCAVYTWYILTPAASVMTSMFLLSGRMVEDRQRNEQWQEERVATTQMWSLAVQQTRRCRSRCMLRWKRTLDHCDCHGQVPCQSYEVSENEKKQVDATLAMCWCIDKELSRMTPKSRIPITWLDDHLTNTNAGSAPAVYIFFRHTFRSSYWLSRTKSTICGKWANRLAKKPAMCKQCCNINIKICRIYDI